MNIVVVEDENQTALFLTKLIERNSGAVVLDIFDSIEETVAYLSEFESRVDLLFLDVHLADGHSFEIFKHVDISIPVIFCTAYNEYSLEAIKHNGIDYIVKPFIEADIKSALAKYIKLTSRIKNRHHELIDTVSLQQPSQNYQQLFITRYRKKSVVVNSRDIALFLIESDLVYVYTKDSQKFPLFKNLAYIASVCDPKQFYQINRQMIVCRNAVVAIQPSVNRKLSLELTIDTEDKDIIVSRLKVKNFKHWLEL